MLIEIGKTYSVYQRTRHTFVEVVIYSHGDDTKVNAESVWRSGGFKVRIEDETKRASTKRCVYRG